VLLLNWHVPDGLQLEPEARGGENMSDNEEQPRAEQPDESVAPSPAAEASSAVKDFEMPDVLLPDKQPEIPPPPQAAPVKQRRKGRLRPIIGLILVVFGILFLGRNLGWFAWFHWGDWWPVILIIIGLLMVFRRSRR
jgi:hypothetical protein